MTKQYKDKQSKTIFLYTFSWYKLCTSIQVTNTMIFHSPQPSDDTC